MTLAPPLWAQNLTYPAEVDRLLIGARLENGCIGGDALAVSQRSNGANMSVDVSAGECVISGGVGTYLCASTAVENRAIAAAPASGSRRDLVYARVIDTQATGTAGEQDRWIIEVEPGVASATPVDPALPDYAIPLARVTIQAGTQSVTTANITDLRTSAEDATKWLTRPVGGRNGQLLRGNHTPLTFNSVKNDWVRLQPSTYDGASAYSESISGPATASSVGPDYTGWRSFTLSPSWTGSTTVFATFSCECSSSGGSAAVGAIRVGISFDNGATYSYPAVWNLGTSANSLTIVPLFCQAMLTGQRESGVPIRLRAVIRSYSATANFERGQMSAFAMIG